jgi:hypothetical protein
LMDGASREGHAVAPARNIASMSLLVSAGPGSGWLAGARIPSTKTQICRRGMVDQPEPRVG